jgi:hypothetical protein
LSARANRAKSHSGDGFHPFPRFVSVHWGPSLGRRETFYVLFLGKNKTKLRSWFWASRRRLQEWWFKLPLGRIQVDFSLRLNVSSSAGHCEYIMTTSTSLKAHAILLNIVSTWRVLTDKPLVRGVRVLIRTLVKTINSVSRDQPSLQAARGDSHFSNTSILTFQH